ncbi:alginate lyase family protein [Raoultella ornithinolytica]|uniref:alginate lyase family protein n=1 Tax=Raoultella ornithinolytica TaxID=54291 RepID=UPI002874DAA9|nr:alginate lyase family protein [Raoultella ornithinolytica]HEC2568567.1 alginate lyase family protein [Raoultella ornithinolytica]HEC2632750.1 alginate lyase family protein [Raoultella ornithinolytica]
MKMVAPALLAIIFQASSVMAEQKCFVIPEQANTYLDSISHTLNASLNKKPNAMDIVHIEHSLPGQPNVIKAFDAYNQFKMMRNSALMWSKNNDDKYLFFSKSYLLAWVLKYKPSLNPIDETPFDALIDTYTIIKPKLNEREKKLVESYFEKWASDYINYIIRKKNSVKGLTPDNWQSHRIKIITMLAGASDNKELFSKATTIFQEQIFKNIKNSGEVYDFSERDALSYAVFDLLPLAQAALVAKNNGYDWFEYVSPSGSSLKKGIDWLLPYMYGAKSHNEFNNTKSEFDKVRRSIGMKDFKGTFNPVRAASLFWMASALDQNYLVIAKKLKETPEPLAVLCKNI